MMSGLGRLRQKNGDQKKGGPFGEGRMKGYQGLLALLALGLCAATGGALLGSDPAALDCERLTRYTARVSFLFFLPVFTLSALSHFVRHPAVLALRPRRRQLGITFGIAHLCHFGAILLLHRHQGSWFTAEDSAALFIYALLGVQVATSNTPAARALGKFWRPTHWVASYALFVGFFTTYLERLQESGELVYLLLFVLASAAWALRVAAFFAKRRPGPLSAT
jgi:hypothetical protein